MALSLRILGQTQGLTSEMRKGGKSVEQLADAFDDMARQADRGGARAESSIDQVGRAGTSAAAQVARGGDRMESTFRDMIRDAGRAERAVDDVGTGGARGLGKIGKAAGEVSQEFGSNLGEAVISVRGDLGELAQVGQDTLGGLAATVAGFGPGGLLAGLGLAGAAVGVGIIAGNIEDAKAKQEEWNALVQGLTDAYVQAGSATVDAAYLASKVGEIAGDEGKRKEAEKLAQVLGFDVPTAMRAMAGEATAVALAQEELAKQTRAYQDTLNPAELKAFNAGLSPLPGAIGEVAGQIYSLADANALATKNAGYVSQALYQFAQEAGTATGEVDDLGNAIYRMPDGKEVVVNVQTKQAHEDLDAFERRKIADRTAIVRLIPDDREIQAWRSPTKVGYVNFKAAQTSGLWDR